MQTVRTTIELDKELLKKAKQKAIEEDKSLRQVVNEVLKKEFGLKTERKNKPKFEFRTYNMGVVKLPLTREEIYEEI